MSNCRLVFQLEWTIGLAARRYHLAVFLICSLITLLAPAAAPIPMLIIPYIQLFQLITTNRAYNVDYLYASLPLKRRSLMRLRFLYFFGTLHVWAIWFWGISLLNPWAQHHLESAVFLGFYGLSLIFASVTQYLIYHHYTYVSLFIVVVFVGLICGYSDISRYCQWLAGQHSALLGLALALCWLIYGLCAALSVRYYQTLEL